jgi:uncharacterized protein YceK
MKKLFILSAVMLLASCSTYRTATSGCATYNDTKAAKERADYPKLHKRNQFNPKRHYNDNIFVRVFRDDR